MSNMPEQQRSEEVERYGTLNSWAQELGVAHDSLGERMAEELGIAGISNGRVRLFFAESEIRRRCADIMSPEIDAQGEVHIGDMICVDTHRFGKSLGLKSKTLAQAITESTLQPIAKARSGNKSVPVYEKQFVEALPVVLAKMSAVSGIGESMVNGTLCIGLNVFAQNNGLRGERLREAVETDGINPFGKARSGNLTVDVYALADIVKLPYVQEQSHKLDKLGETTINGIRCVGIVRYAQINRLTHKSLMEDVKAALLSVIGKARSGKTIVEVYAKAAVDLLPYCQQHRLKVDQKGEVRIGERILVGIWRYARYHRLNAARLLQHVSEAGLVAAGRGSSKQQIIDLFLKEEVEVLPYVRERLKVVPADSLPTSADE